VNATGAQVPLVTGATGFAGSHLIEQLLASYPTIAAWGHAKGRPLPSQDRRVRWQSVDLLDRAGVKRALQHVAPTVIFHLAGLPHVAESWKSAGRALEVNALGTHHLLDCVEETLPGCKVVVAGSALVYRPSASALAEDDQLGPADPYGVSKLAQEMRAGCATTPVILTRPFNHAGPGQSEAFVTSSFAKQIAEIEAGVREPRLLVGNLEARRDIMDVRDTARAYEALATAGIPGRVYNICSGRAHRIGDLLDRLIAMARTRITVEQDPARLRPSDNPVVLGDPSRIIADTGWRPQIPITTTLADLLAWWRARIAPGR
jgi:GDP-4-dehydro-6-deoxy-D-mannose reductase